jgi:hypothetical protein
MEATCDAQWFERMPQEHHHELWIGEAAEIRAAMVRKQETDPRAALHILDLLLANCFPRIWKVNFTCVSTLQSVLTVSFISSGLVALKV